ncbi:cytochrome oxidase putative small subunit CydP [Sulfurivermis fontis]|uniref:cytochrome oxidase putative small subunit CydP n=1 Tax=Sulfurivermis fontis TaxID=1972068 RepID=UPI000FD9A806|nr:cytochrome oxidase putative small subunit CydP [Sulfurivermis fontis]
MFSNPLVREIAVVLVIKLIFIYALWFAFFRPGEVRPPLGEELGHALLFSGRAPEPIKPQP